MSDKDSSFATWAVILLIIAAVFIYTRDPSPYGTSTAVTNPTHVQFESLDHNTLTDYEVDVIGASGTVVQTLRIPKSATTVQGGLVDAPLRLYPLEPGTFTVAVRAVTEVIEQPAAGARVPPNASVQDGSGGTWTIGSDGVTILRNMEDSWGRGTEILIWDTPAVGSVYVYGTDQLWYRWTGGVNWVDAGGDPSGGATGGGNPVGTFARSVSSAPSNAWMRAPIAVF